MDFHENRFAVDLPDDLYDVTLNQLRILLALRRHGLRSEAADWIGKTQGALKNSMDTLERKFGGGKLITSGPRNEAVEFTKEGRIVGDFAEVVFAELERCWDAIHRSKGLVRIATTSLMIPVLCKVWLELDLNHHDFTPDVRHIRSHQAPGVLKEDPLCDFCFGGTIEPSVGCQWSNQYEYSEWQREGFGILTNQDFPFASVTPELLTEEALPLYLPREGLVADFLLRRFSVSHFDSLSSVLNIRETTQELEFDISLMRYGVHVGSMVVAEHVGVRYAVTSPRSDQGERALHYLPLEQSEPQLQISAGLFRRCHEDGAPDLDRAAGQFWRTYERCKPKRPSD